MGEPKHISEIVNKILSRTYSFKSSVVEDSSDYDSTSFQTAKVVDAYFAPSQVQRHEDLHLWFETSKGQKEFILSDVVKTGELFSLANIQTAKDFLGKDYSIFVSKNKFTKNYLVSSLIIKGKNVPYVPL